MSNTFKEITLNIPVYNSSSGLKNHWENGFEISVIANNEVTIKANKAGLISLAIQLLTLSQDDVSVNSHFHFDEYNSLEAGSIGLIIQKS